MPNILYHQTPFVTSNERNKRLFVIANINNYSFLNIKEMSYTFNLGFHIQ